MRDDLRGKLDNLLAPASKCGAANRHSSDDVERKAFRNAVDEFSLIADSVKATLAEGGSLPSEVLIQYAEECSPLAKSLSDTVICAELFALSADLGRRAAQDTRGT